MSHFGHFYRRIFMNKKEIGLRLRRLDAEKKMVMNYLKNSEHDFAREIYKNTLEYIEFQLTSILKELEKDKTGVKYEH